MHIDFKMFIICNVVSCGVIGICMTFMLEVQLSGPKGWEAAEECVLYISCLEFTNLLNVLSGCSGFASLCGAFGNTI